MLDVDLMQAEVGATVELGNVLLVSGGSDIRVGTPLVDGARVVAEVMEHGRGPKIRIFKYKNKTRYRRRLGHRQDFTRLQIREILAEGLVIEAPVEEAKPKRARKRAAPKPKAVVEPEATPVVEAEAPEAEPEAAPVVAEPEVAAETPAAEPKPARKRAAAKPKSTALKPRSTTPRARTQAATPPPKPRGRKKT